MVLKQSALYNILFFVQASCPQAHVYQWVFLQLIATNSLPNFYLPAEMICQESMMLKMHCTRLQHWTISRMWMRFIHEHRVLSTEMHKEIIQAIKKR